MMTYIWYTGTGAVPVTVPGGFRGRCKPLNKMQFVIQIAYLATVVGALFKEI